ncbi:hypothetical protein D9M73_112330 [compost metagenome]
MTANASSDNTTTAATRQPARMTERASTPSPSAAIDIMVRKFAVTCIGAIAASGMAPNERKVSSSKKPTMGSPRFQCNK